MKVSQSTQRTPSTFPLDRLGKNSLYVSPWSWNRGKIWVGRDLKVHPVPPLPRSGTPSLPLPNFLLALNPSRDGPAAISRSSSPSFTLTSPEQFQRIKGNCAFSHLNYSKENLGESPLDPKRNPLNVQISLCSTQAPPTLGKQFTCLQHAVFLAYFPQEMGLTPVIVLFIYLYAITPTLITFERVGQFQPNLTERQSFQKY